MHACACYVHGVSTCIHERGRGVSSPTVLPQAPDADGELLADLEEELSALAREQQSTVTHCVCNGTVTFSLILIGRSLC